MQAQDIINLAAKDIGQLDPGLALETEEMTDCLAKLNQLIALWDTEYLNIFCVQATPYTLTGSRTTPYTIGAGAADFNTTRPVSIRSAVIITASGSFSFALELLTVEKYARIIEKNATGEPPEALYYDANYPVASLYLYPWPSAGDTLQLFTWEQLTSFATPTTSFDMPPGYAEALEWNLCLTIAPMFGRPLTQDVINKAAATKASIRANNAPPGPGNAEVVQASGAAVPVPPDAGNAMNR